MSHASFFPTLDTTFTSDDIFTVAQPTPGIASTITFSPRRPPPMHSTPLSRHTSSSYLPNTSCLPQSLGQTPTLIQASSTSDHSEGIPIYIPVHESSSSSFSGFSETLINRARTITSPLRKASVLDKTPLFDFYNTPTCSCHLILNLIIFAHRHRAFLPYYPHTYSPPFWLRTLLIPSSFDWSLYLVHHSLLCQISQIQLPLCATLILPLESLVIFILLRPHQSIRSLLPLLLIVVTLVYDRNLAAHSSLTPNHGKKPLIFPSVFFAFFQFFWLIIAIFFTLALPSVPFYALSSLAFWFCCCS